RARGSGSGAIVHQQNVPIVDDHHVVAAEAAGSIVDAIRNLFELIGLALRDGIGLGRERGDREQDGKHTSSHGKTPLNEVRRPVYTKQLCWNLAGSNKQ